jgi:hypothetical protein
MLRFNFKYKCNKCRPKMKILYGVFMGFPLVVKLLNYMYSPPSFPPLCVAKRGNCLLYNKIAPPLYRAEREKLTLWVSLARSQFVG